MRKRWTLFTSIVIVTMLITSFPLSTTGVLPSLAQGQGVSQLVITAANADKLGQIAYFGIGGGVNAKMAWSPDGKKLAVSHLAGTWVFETNNWQTPIYSLPSTAKEIQRLRFSPNGDYLLVFTGTRDISLYDPQNGKVRLTLQASIQSDVSVLNVVFSPDGNLLAATTSEKKLKLWDLHSGSLLLEEPAEYYPDADTPLPLAFSPDSQLLAYNTPDEQGKEPVAIWDIPARTMRTRLPVSRYNDSPAVMAFSPDGQWLGVGSQGGYIKLWNTATWTDTGYLLDPEAEPYTGYSWIPIYALAFSADSQTLIAADLSLRSWDISTRARQFEISTFARQITSITHTADNRALALASTDHSIIFRSARTGKELVSLINHYGPVQSAEFNRDNTILASTGSDGMVRLWAVTNRSPNDLDQALPSQNPARITPQNGDKLAQIDVLGRGTVTSVAWSPDDTLLAVSTMSGVWLYDVQKLAGPPRVFAYGHQLNDVAFSPDGKLIAAADSDFIVRLWNVKTGDAYGVWRRHIGPVTSLAFSADGSVLASGGDYPDRTVRLWDVKSGDQRLEISPPLGFRVSDVALSPDQKTVAAALGAYSVESGSNGYIYTWDTATGAQGNFIRMSGTTHKVAFRRDGKLLVVMGYWDDLVELWDIRTPQEQAQKIVPSQAGYGFSSIAFSTGGTLAAIGEEASREGQSSQKLDVELRDIEKGTTVAVLKDHPGTVVSIAFNHANTLIATASESGSVYVWDLTTYKRWAILNVSEAAVLNRVQFNADSTALVASNFDGEPPNKSNGKAFYGCFLHTPQVWTVPLRRQIPFTGCPERLFYDVVLNADGKQVITVDMAGKVQSWDLAADKAINTYPSDTPAPYGLAISQDGQKLTILGSTENGTYSSFTHDLTRTIEAWDLKTQKMLAQYESAYQIYRFALSADGRWLAVHHPTSWDTSSYAQATDVWDLVGLSIVLIVPGTANPYDKGLALSADGQLLAVVDGGCYGDGCQIAVWSVAKAKPIQYFWGHDDSVTSLAFSPDGKLLASAGLDDTIRLWDMESGKELAVRQHRGVESIAFSPDGTLLASVGRDGLIRLWSVPPDDF